MSMSHAKLVLTYVHSTIFLTMPASCKLNAASASASLNAKYMVCSDIRGVADTRNDGQNRHVITTYWLDKEQVMFDVTYRGSSSEVWSNSVAKFQKNEGYFIDAAQHEYSKGTKRDAYSSNSEWTLRATDYTKITLVPPNDFPIPATPITTFDHVLKYPRCPHNVVGVVVHASNIQQIKTTWKISFKLGSPKCDALLPVELWRTCAQHPIGNGPVIGFHHVYWSFTKGVAIANGNANQVIMNDSELSPSVKEDDTKWVKGFDSKKLETIGQSKRVIDFRTFLDTNPNEWKYDQEYLMDVSFQGLGNPVTHNACVDCGTKKPNEDFLFYKCNQKSKVTSHYFPILQLGTPVKKCSMATIWWENKFSIWQPMNLVKRYFNNPTLLIPLCKKTALDAAVESFLSIVKIQGPRNPFITFPILNFSLMKKRQKIHFFPLQVHHSAPLHVTRKHKWTVCLDGMPNSRTAVIQPLVVSMPFCANIVGILM